MNDDKLDIFEDDTSELNEVIDDIENSTKEQEGEEQYLPGDDSIVEQSAKGLMEDTALIDIKFKDIEQNVMKQVLGTYSEKKANDKILGEPENIEKTRVIRLQDVGLFDRESITSRGNQRDLQDEEYTPHYEDDYIEEKSEGTKMVLLLLGSFLLGVILTMACIMMFNNVLGPIKNTGNVNSLTNQVKRLEGLLEQANEDIATRDSDIELYINQVESLQEQIEEMETSIEDKDTNIEELKQTLDETEAELKEMQFRADMFQKYGPDWEK